MNSYVLVEELLTEFCLFSFMGRRLDKREVERIREEVRKVVTKGRAPGLLRLVFHDAGTFETNDTSG